MGEGFSKCVEVQQLTRHLEVKYCFGASRESGSKSRQTMNTRLPQNNKGQGWPVRR